MDKRQQILDAALKLFVAYGFHDTPTSKIAQEAGVANGTLFHYFKTKEDLIVALYTEIKDKMAAYLEENHKTEDSIKGNMKSHYLSTLYWGLDNRIEFKYIEQFNASPFLALIPVAELEKQLKTHFEILELGIQKKKIKPMPVDFLFSMISSQAYGLIHYLSLREFSKTEQHKYINDSFDMLWNMIT